MRRNIHEHNSDRNAGSGQKHHWRCPCQTPRVSFCGFGSFDSGKRKPGLLHEILEQDGIDGFNAIENRVNASIEMDRAVIATGGSAVYGAEAMDHLKSIGTVLYLRIPYEVLKERLGDLHERGVSMKEGQTLKDLYEERRPLYEKYADVVIDCEGRTIREIVHEIADELRGENE